MTPGQIASIAINIRNATPWPVNRSVTIRMASTAANALTGSWNMAGFTTVFTNPAFNIPVVPLATPQWLTFNFQTPFMWDGVSNLIIDFCTYRNGNTFLFPDWESTTVGAPNTNVWGAQNYYDHGGADNCANTPGFASIYRPSRRPVLLFGVLSGIESSFPDDVDPRRILLQGQIYNGVDPRFPKPSLSFRQTAGQSINLTYRIVGPLPATNVIYEGRKSGNPTINHVAATTALFTYEMTEATGPAAGVNGTLDLRFTAGGSYRLEASYQIPGYTQQWSKEFSIAFPNDLMVRQIRSPLSIPRKYPRGVEMPVSAQIQNVGLNNVTDALVIASIRHLATNSEVYRDTVVWSGNLATGEIATVDFANYSTLNVATYAITVCTELLSAVDQQTANDCQPTSGNYILRLSTTKRSALKRSTYLVPPARITHVARSLLAAASSTAVFRICRTSLFAFRSSRIRDASLFTIRL
ncbi:MAG: hypothetical protein IPH49_03560 [Ignavibacteria bacterium]|nr:hypothetical protein [Ignavibacteria bacterium]